MMSLSPSDPLWHNLFLIRSLAASRARVRSAKEQFWISYERSNLPLTAPLVWNNFPRNVIKVTNPSCFYCPCWPSIVVEWVPASLTSWVICWARSKFRNNLIDFINNNIFVLLMKQSLDFHFDFIMVKLDDWNTNEFLSPYLNYWTYSLNYIY